MSRRRKSDLVAPSKGTRAPPYAERITAESGHRDRVAANLGLEPSSLQWTLEDELDFLVIHGLLHLIGHDHAEPEEEQLMRAEERRLWLHAVER